MFLLANCRNSLSNKQFCWSKIIYNCNSTVHKLPTNFSASFMCDSH